MPLPAGPTGPVPDGSDPQEYDRLRRRVLWSMPTGLFVVGSRAGDRRNLMTCNWVMQVATTPKLVAVAVEAGSVTNQLLAEGGSFAVSILARDDRAVVRRFVKPATEVVVDGNGAAVSIQGEPVHEVRGGVPVLASAVAWLACEVRCTTGGAAQPASNAAQLASDAAQLASDAAQPPSHTLFVGEVVDAGEAAPDAEVLRMEDTRMNYGG